MPTVLPANAALMMAFQGFGGRRDAPAAGPRPHRFHGIHCVDKLPYRTTVRALSGVRCVPERPGPARAEAAAARRLDHEHVARAHVAPCSVAPNSSRVPSLALDPVAAAARPASRPRRRTARTRRGWRASRPSSARGSARGARRRRRRDAGRAPPLPRRIANASSRTGKRHSSTSGSVSRELVMCVCTALAPSKSGPAPAPPAIVS